MPGLLLAPFTLQPDQQPGPAGDGDSEDGGGDQRSLADTSAAGADRRIDPAALAGRPTGFLEIVAG